MKEMPKSKLNKIFSDYAAYLDERSIPYHNRHGFYVCAPLKHLLPDGTPVTRARELSSFTHVYDNFDGGLSLYDYFGSCYTGVRIAKRVMKIAGMIEKGSAIGYDMVGEECWER